MLVVAAAFAWAAFTLFGGFRLGGGGSAENPWPLPTSGENTSEAPTTAEPSPSPSSTSPSPSPSPSATTQLAVSNQHAVQSGDNGFGWVINLAQKSTVTRLEIGTQNTGGLLEVRATTADAPTSGPVLASVPFAEKMTVKLSKPTETNSIVLWFPQIPESTTGRQSYVQFTNIDVY